MNKAVFLDRDRTIIEDKEGYLRDPAKVKILPGAAEAIKKLNTAGFKVIVATNQAGISYGYLTEETLEAIHQKMTKLLKEKGALIDDIYYCPHHPEAKISKYRKVCPNRKPSPGMLIKATLKHDIDLKKSYFVGDDERDVHAGKNAGCTTFLISNDPKIETEADKVVSDLAEAVSLIILAS